MKARKSVHDGATVLCLLDVLVQVKIHRIKPPNAADSDTLDWSGRARERDGGEGEDGEGCEPQAHLGKRSARERRSRPGAAWAHNTCFFALRSKDGRGA